MRDEDLEWLVRQLIGTAELLGQQMTPTAAALMAEDLSGFPREALARALRRVRAEHTGKLSPKVVFDRLESLAGRLAPSEAWAHVIRAQDERNTVVWTDEMRAAWQVAAPIMDARDKVGARMAFIDAYGRLVAEAREARRLPVMVVSIGWDVSQRAAALDQAVTQGLLTAEVAAEHAGANALAMPAPVFNPVALLAGTPQAVTKDAPPAFRARLAQLREEIAGRKPRARAQVLARAERMALARRKRETDAAVRARLEIEQS